MDPDLGRYPVVWAAAGLPTAVFGVPPGTLRILSNATVVPIAEEAAADRSARRRLPWASAPAADRAAPRDVDRTTERDSSPIRAACARAGAGAAAARGRRSSPCPRPAARWSTWAPSPPTIPSRCAAPSCASRARAARGRRASRRSSTTSRARSTGTPQALLVVAYGFHTYGLEVASGDARWDHRSATPLIALLGSPRLAHVVVQSELETFAIEPDGTVAWRVAHSDVVSAADLLGGRLVLTSFDGQVRALDPATGRSAA